MEVDMEYLPINNHSFTLRTLCKLLGFLIMYKVTEKMPQCKLDRMKLAIPDNFTLADPNFEESASIDHLLDNGFFVIRSWEKCSSLKQYKKTPK